MICINCREGKEQECLGITKHKTWCDSQHKDAVTIDPLFCKHLKLTSQNEYCPSCGKPNDEGTKDASGDTEQQDTPKESSHIADPEDKQDQILIKQREWEKVKRADGTTYWRRTSSERNQEAS